MFRFDTVAHLFFSVTPALNNMERSGMLFNVLQLPRSFTFSSCLAARAVCYGQIELQF